MDEKGSTSRPAEEYGTLKAVQTYACKADADVDAEDVEALKARIWTILLDFSTDVLLSFWCAFQVLKRELPEVPWRRVLRNRFLAGHV